MNIMSKIKEAFLSNKVENILLYLSIFLIAVYTNVMCISDFIYKNSVIIACTFILSICIVLLYIFLKKKKITILKDEIGYFILLIFMLINNYDIMLGDYNDLIKFLLFMSFIILIKHLNWEKALLRILLVIGIGHLVISLFSYINTEFYIENIVPLFNLDSIYLRKLLNQINNGCLLGLASHHSTSGIYFSIAYFTAMAFTFKQDKINKKYGILSLVFLVCILLTRKRGPFIFALMVSAIYVYIYYKNKSEFLIRARKWYIKNKVGILTVIIVLFITIVGFLYLTNIITYEKLNDLTSNRIADLWIPALIIFFKNPILGIGWGGYKYEYLLYSGFNVINNNAHCIYLQLLAETGIIGFAIIIYIMLRTLYKTYTILVNIINKKYKVNEYIKASMIFSFIMQLFFLIYGFTGNPLYDYAVFLPYMIACGLCYSFIYKEKQYIEKEEKDYNRLRVAIVSAGRQPIPPVKGGAVETGIYQIIKEYDKDDDIMIDLTVYSIYDEKAEIMAKENKADIIFIKLTKGEEIFNKLIYIINAILRKAKIKFSITSNIPFINKVKESIKFRDFDVILIKNRVDFLLPISKIHNTVILQIHNDYLNKNTYNAEKIVKESAKIVCVSQYIKDKVIEISEEAKNKTIVNLNCVDIDMFEKKISIERAIELKKKYSISNDDKVIIFSGRLNKEKGIKELLLALNKLPKELQFKLLIVGAPWYSSNKVDKFTKELKEIAKENEEKIKFTGYIKYDKLWEIYAISNIAIVPSIWEEPAGRVIIEAEAAGIPLIITDAGGMKEYVNNKNAIIIHRDDDLIRNLSNSIKELLIDENKLKEMGQEGRKIVENLSPRHYYEEFIEFTKGVVEENENRSSNIS